MTTLSNAEIEKLARDLCAELPLIEVRLRQAGLWSTAIEMNKVIRMAGFETAALIEEAALTPPASDGEPGDRDKGAAG